MEVKTILFDLDGTLVDSLQLIEQTYRKVFQDMNIPWGDGDVLKWLGRPLVDIAANFAGRDKKEEFIERYQGYYKEEHDKKIKLFPGTYEMLEWMRQRGFKLGVVTSKGRPTTVHALNLLDVSKFLGAVITAHDVNKYKPDPEPVLEALKVLGASAESALYVGDSPFDIMAGQEAGTGTAGVTWGIATREELEKYNPTYILDSWEELKQVVASGEVSERYFKR